MRKILIVLVVLLTTATINAQVVLEGTINGTLVNGYTISPNDINEITEKMLLISKEIEPLKEVVLKKNEMIHRYDELIDKTIEYINSI